MLVRKLLRLEEKPALLYLHAYSPTFEVLSFWKGAQSDLDTILQYYSIPTASVRNALYHLIIAKAPGFEDTLDGPFCAHMHPNGLGHR